MNSNADYTCWVIILYQSLTEQTYYSGRGVDNGRGFPYVGRMRNQLVSLRLLTVCPLLKQPYFSFHVQPFLLERRGRESLLVWLSQSFIHPRLLYVSPPPRFLFPCFSFVNISLKNYVSWTFLCATYVTFNPHNLNKLLKLPSYLINGKIKAQSNITRTR